MIYLKTLDLRVVKEKSALYDLTNNKVTCPNDAYVILELIFEMGSLAEEKLVMLCVNTKNEVIGAFSVSHGTLNSSLVHPREVLKRALLVNARGFFLAHNHPSGDTEPSSEDIASTSRLLEASKIMGVDFIDHLIIGDCKYYSMQQNGLM